MQIKYFGRDKFEIKVNQGLIALDSHLAINGFDLSGPGEYEKSGVVVLGIPDGQNTIYLIRAEEMTVCHLGHIARELPESEIKEIGDVDILFLSLGEEGTLPAKKALSLLSKIDPKIVIPMLFSDLSEFKKSEGLSDGEVDILKIKPADLPEDERKIVILKTQTR